MFNGNNNGFTMPVMPAAYGGMSGGMGGWNNDWVALAIIAMIFGGNGFGFGGWGGGLGAMEMFLPFMFMNGGWGGFGNGGGSASAQGALTREQACIDNNFQNLMRETAGISDAVNVGFANLNSTICHQQYDTAQLVNGINTNVANGFHGVDNALCQLGYQTQQGFNTANVVALQNQNALQTQLANCCCENRVGQMQLGNSLERGLCDVNYNSATNTTAIIQNAHNDTDRVLAKLDAMEMARKDETIADLRTKLAACGDQTTAQYIINQITGIVSPRAVPAYPATSPCGLGNWSPQVLANGWSGWNNGCGCNSGCCGCNA